ncbi:MAG TPA: hypothetical protein VLS53_05535 [Candidatus Dormibacteraeota bacterium]|nr:hypothetical protein [Candidatus Dormibacteraeota bacterium]
MSEGFAMRWPVRQMHTVTPAQLDATGAISDRTLEEWVSAACTEYLDGCTVLESLRARSGLSLVRQARQLPGGERLGCPTTVVVSASVPEVRPSSFTLAVRLRPVGGDDAGHVIDSSCLVHLENAATGEPADLGEAVRDELIAIERSARHHN